MKYFAVHLIEQDKQDAILVHNPVNCKQVIGKLELEKSSRPMAYIFATSNVWDKLKNHYNKRWTNKLNGGQLMKIKQKKTHAWTYIDAISHLDYRNIE